MTNSDVKTPLPFRLLSVSEVASAMGVCERTVRRLIESKKLKAKRIGRSVRVDERDLASFLDNQ